MLKEVLIRSLSLAAVAGLAGCQSAPPPPVLSIAPVMGTPSLPAYQPEPVQPLEPFATTESTSPPVGGIHDTSMGQEPDSSRAYPSPPTRPIEPSPEARPSGTVKDDAKAGQNKNELHLTCSEKTTRYYHGQSQLVQQSDDYPELVWLDGFDGWRVSPEFYSKEETVGTGSSAIHGIEMINRQTGSLRAKSIYVGDPDNYDIMEGTCHKLGRPRF